MDMSKIEPLVELTQEQKNRAQSAVDLFARVREVRFTNPKLYKFLCEVNQIGTWNNPTKESFLSPHSVLLQAKTLVYLEDDIESNKVKARAIEEKRKAK